MAYNLYQVQMAKAWTERVNKEAAMAEKFWFDRAKDGSVSRGGSVAGSEFPSSQVLKNKLEALEGQLATERAARLKVEAGPGGYCSPRPLTHIEPSCLE